MTLKEILEFLKARVHCPCWRASRQDWSEKRSITIYEQEPPEIAPEASYGGKHVLAVIHWGTSADEAEAKAQELYDALDGYYDKNVGFTVMLTAGPEYIGLMRGEIEYKVEFNIYYPK